MVTRNGQRRAARNQFPPLRTPVMIGSRFDDWVVTWLGWTLFCPAVVWFAKRIVCCEI